MKVAIIGLGLIGGSIALGLKGSGHYIIGVENNPEFSAYAKNSGMVNEITTLESLAEHKPEVVFVCVPVHITREIAQKVYSVVGDSAIITDVASVKSIMEGLPGRIVGGHPMAGTENSGIYASRQHLFENAYYVLVSYKNTAPADFEVVKSLVLSLSANPITMTAQTHDERVSKISHLPHIIAYALSSYALGNDGFVGSGFMDTTRISASSPDFWTRVALLNRDNLLSDIKSYRAKLAEFETAVENRDEIALKSLLVDGQQKRQKVTYHRPYINEYNFTLDLKDEVGSLLSIVKRLADASVNISGIQIVNSREGVGGALKVSVKSERDYKKAKEIFNFNDEI